MHRHHLIPMKFSEVAGLARTQDKLQALRHKTAGKREIFTGGRFRSSHQSSHHQRSVIIQAGLALFSTPVKLLSLVGFGVSNIHPRLLGLVWPVQRHRHFAAC